MRPAQRLALPLAAASLLLLGSQLPAEYQLVWADEFNQADGSAPDPSNWAYDVGYGPNNDGWGNWESQYYTDSTENARIHNGHLVIELHDKRDDPVPGLNEGQTHDFTSARLVTRGVRTWTYGRFEARIRLPHGLGSGLWPAFWTLGSNIQEVGWPFCGEIDVMEYFSREPNEVTGAMHGPGYSGGNPRVNYLMFDGPVAPPVPLSLPDFANPSDPVFNTDFRVYAVEWEPNEVRWYVDGVLFHRVTSDDVLPNAWAFNHDHYLLLNLAIGGFFQDIDPTLVFPTQMVVDYVRVYRDTALEFPTTDLPGIAQAEDFTRQFGVLPEPTVDTGGGRSLGSLQAGDWAEYTVRAAQAGSFAVDLRVAKANDVPVSVLVSAGEMQVESPALVGTGGWQQWTTVTAGEIALPEGESTVRVEILGEGGDAVNLNWLRFRAPLVNEPVVAAVVDDFESGFANGQDADGNVLGFFGLRSEDSTLSLAGVPSDRECSVGTVLRGESDAQNWMGVGRTFANEALDTWVSADWRGYDGISFWFRGGGSGVQFTFDILDNRLPGASLFDTEQFVVSFVDDVAGWRRLEFPFADFTRRTGSSGAPDDGLNLSEMHGWMLGHFATEGLITYEIDDVKLWRDPAVAPTPLLGVRVASSFIDENESGYAEAGETIRYTYVLVNEGNLPLSGILLEDSIADVTGGIPSNLLENGDFESGATAPWSGAGSVVPTPGTVFPWGSSTHSLQIAGAGNSFLSAYQTIPAEAGQEFSFSGYLYADSLPDSGPFALLKIVFRNAEGTDIEPAEVVIGQRAGSAFPGAESTPVLNLGNVASGWVFSEARALAPVGTVSVSFYAINIDLSPATFHFDALRVTDGAGVLLAVGQEDCTSFAGTYVLTEADIEAGQVTNVATAISGFGDVGTMEHVTELPVEPPFVPVVTNTDDSGPGSLRAVVAAAPPGETITFAPELNGAAIVLTNGQILVEQSYLGIDAAALPNGISISGSSDGDPFVTPGESRHFEVAPGATLMLRGLTLREGVSDYGGSILVRGQLQMFFCTVRDNVALRNGGGIETALGGVSHVEGSTFWNNRAESGGALSVSGRLVLNNSTVTGNRASSLGGAIFNYDGDLTVLSGTLVDNVAELTSGGIHLFYGGTGTPTLDLRGSIVADNAAPEHPNVAGEIPAGNFVGVGAQLRPLANYGGPTWTMPPLPGSPAIDAGIDANSPYDQRRLPRGVDGNLDGIAEDDLGAVESYEGARVETDELWYAGIDFSGVSMVGSDLRAADFSDASLDGALLTGAIYGRATRFPPDFDPIAAGMIPEAGPEPTTAALVEDFETGVASSQDANGNPVEFLTFVGSESTVAIGTEVGGRECLEGSAVLRVDASAATYAGVGYNFVLPETSAWTPVDWRGYDGVSFWFHGAGNGTAFFFDVVENRTPGSTIDDAERFTVSFVDDVVGWRRLEFRFADFVRKEVGNGAPEDGFTLENVHGWAIGHGATEGPITYFMDDLRLVRDPMFAPTPRPYAVVTATFIDENESGYAEVGETIHYTYTLVNEGNVDLTGVSLRDSLGTLPDPLSRDILGNGDFEDGSREGWVGTGEIAATAPVPPWGPSLYSIRLPGSGNAFPTLSRVFPARPGFQYEFSGSIVAESLVGETAYGLLKIVFRDADGNDLVPASVSSGRLVEGTFPGAESATVVSLANAAEGWIRSEIRASAPEGTAFVAFLAINVDLEPASFLFDELLAYGPAGVALAVGEADCGPYSGTYTLTAADLESGRVVNLVTVSSFETGPGSFEHVMELPLAPFVPIVTNTENSGPGSLRAVVAAAAPGDTITFAPELDGATISLLSPIFISNPNLRIDAEDLPAGLTLTGNSNGDGVIDLGESSHFIVTSGAVASLSHLTLIDGISDRGGSILSLGRLAATSCTFRGNRALGWGGAIAAGSELLALSGCTLVNNRAAVGGAIASYGDNSTLIILTSTLTGNAAEDGGAVHGRNVSSLGVRYSTIVGNSAEGNGGGIFLATLIDNPGSEGVYQSIIADNVAPMFPNLSDLEASTSFVGTGARLAPLGDYGGRTWTMPPLPGSPAIDQLESWTGSLDQRGLPRGVDGDGDGLNQADLGAVESYERIRIASGYPPFEGADFRRVSLRGSDLRGGNFSGANLDGAILTEALYDAATLFPTGFDPEAAGMIAGFTSSELEAVRAAARAEVVDAPGGYNLFTMADLDLSRSLGRGDVLADPSAYGLYDESSIEDLSLGRVMIRRDVDTGEFILAFRAESTPDLGSEPFAPLGSARVTFSEETGLLELRFDSLAESAEFYRLHFQPETQVLP